MTSDLELGRRTFHVLVDLASACQPDLDQWFDAIETAMPRLNEIGLLRTYLTFGGPELQPELSTDGTTLVVSAALVLRRIARELAAARGDVDDLDTALYDLRSWIDEVLGEEPPADVP